MKRIFYIAGPVGMALLVVGAGWAVLAPRLHPGTYRGLVVVGLLMLLPAIWGWRQTLRDPVGGKRVRFGANALVTAAVVVSIVLLLNFFAVRYRERWDLTRARVFSLHPVTMRVLDSIDREVDVFALFSEREPLAARAVEGLYETFKFYTPTMSLTVADPQRRPDLMQELGVRGTQLTVVRSGERVVAFPDPGDATEREAQLAAALREVTRDTDKVIYWIYGHGERPLEAEGELGYQVLQRELASSFYRVETLSLGPGQSVPEDASLLIIADPQDPIQESELAAYDAYLRRGGSILALTDVDMKQRTSDENPLAPLLARWGIRALAGVAIDARPEKLGEYEDTWTVLGEQYGRHESVAALRGKRTVYIGARPLQFFQVLEDQQIFHHVMVRAGRGVYAETDLERAASGRAGDSVAMAEAAEDPPILGIAAFRRFEPRPGETHAGTQARFVVFGDADFLNNAQLPQRANDDLALNVVNWITGEELLIRREGERQMGKTAVTIEPPRMRRVRLGLVLEPVVVLLIGGVIWFLRRSK
ncbi:MAG: GldG family protein [Acidobacteriota bacterium]|nr:MAG: GldG family protein [Acidobacteriota bacterium]